MSCAQQGGILFTYTTMTTPDLALSEADRCHWSSNPQTPNPVVPPQVLDVQLQGGGPIEFSSDIS